MNKSEERVFDIFQQAYKNKRLHHSILLYGPSIRGLEEMAKRIISLILDCQDCSKHPDFFTLRPQGKARFIKIGSKADKSGDRWPENTMRHLLQELRQTSNMGGNKAALVYEADRMNQESANAFLKTLEEPPPATTIILITQRPNDILDTIKSRCISVRIDSNPDELTSPLWDKWLEDFENWVKKSATGKSAKEQYECVIECYGLLSRLDMVLNSFSKESISEEESVDMDEEMLEAIESSERKNLRKTLLSQIENKILNAACGGEISITKISRCIENLEKCAGLMELNMKDTTSFEYFMLNALRILSAKDK